MLEFRLATLNDLDQLVELRVQFLYEAQEIDAKQSAEALRQSLREYFEKTIADGTFLAWVAVTGNMIVGTSGVCFYTVPPCFSNLSGKVAYIMNMYTLPEWRKKGIGSSLLEKLLESSKSLGITKLRLIATAAGRPLYAKYGFKPNEEEMTLSLKDE